MDTFAQRKAAAMAELASPAPDKSPKGGVDAPIIPLLDLLNSHPSFFTTSSCSGRISILLSNPDPSTNQVQNQEKKKKKAGGGRWLFVSHEKAELETVLKLLFGDLKEEDVGFEAVLRFEPMIVAVDCRDLDAARQLVGVAISSGFRESGITSVQKRVMVAVRCSIRMEVPLGQVGNLLVSDEYVSYLIGIANRKLEANKQRTNCFLHALKEKLASISGEQNPSEQDDSNIEPSSFGAASLVPNGNSGLKLDDSNIELGCICEEEEKEEKSRKSLNSDSSKESLQNQRNSLSASVLNVTGEQIEKMFLWGQSACVYINNKVLIFGGFGGIGRHSRRNYSLILDASSGLLTTLVVDGPPLERMGHSVSLVGEDVYVIGGRAGPLEILNDVWVLKKNANEWLQLECSGDMFKPRHRHAAAVVGTNIYVFGGLSDEEIYSCMNVLDIRSMQWKQINGSGEWPGPCHSHAMVAQGFKLFLFGGHNGHKPLGDLYSFDTASLSWKREIISGKPPFARFSHSMFAYNNYIGILGGCPFRQQEHQKLALLDLDRRKWVYAKIESLGKRNMWVRCSAVVIDDKLVLVGGGASCYAFGTYFSPPMKLNLSFLKTLEGVDSDPSFVFQVEKEYAKQIKDVLKRSGWLDLNRKVKVTQNGRYVLFPVNGVFCEFFISENVNGEKEILISCGGSLERDKLSINRKGPKSPQNLMRELVKPLLERSGMPLEFLEQLPTRWEQLGDMVVLPKNSFKDPQWDLIAKELWPIVANSLGTQRLARQGSVMPTGTRDSGLELLVGSDGWVTHHENGISYSLDATKCIFSWGNRSEKLRIAALDCINEVIVDLFAGIGYFVLPFLVKSHAKLVYACEWNPNALTALRRNLLDNLVADQCIVLEGDNRITAPKGVADRVCLGLLPSSEGSWITAVRALRAEGGTLHVHGNVNDSEEGTWPDYVVQSITTISQNEGLPWHVNVQHVERVKWYGPHILHLVVDVKCRRI
ncbi:hypothetical protein LUZ63_000707 [Rhynchospora breviuscula]|uniref:SAM-dependent methyltransferase TRM5/TYW2-type domain-containing protein n=1 Tax=Rhynchospora breviuscula TaxID=2022672 RepID=A0A9Q0CVE8_9POAL|nr:hypothetical protein LUZ63_000707 [Rhynchospora breviuscula]